MRLLELHLFLMYLKGIMAEPTEGAPMITLRYDPTKEINKYKKKPII